MELSRVKTMMSQAANRLILVTGATGFLGSVVVRQLQRQGCRLRTTARRKQPSFDLPDYRAGDLVGRAATAGLANGVDTVIHVAGLTHDPAAAPRPDEDFFRVNTEGSKSLIEAAAAAGCRRFVFVSSISVYGRGRSPVTEAAECSPGSAYTKSKLAAEEIVSKTAQAADMELAILRMAPICGEGARGNVDRLMKSINGRCFLWIGTGANRKSLIHVEDAARACVTAACCELFPCSGAYNVSAAACTMQEIVSALATALQRKIPPIKLPGRVPMRIVGGISGLPAIGPVAERAFVTLDKWLCDEVYDSALFRRSFAWRPTIEIREALTRQVMYYRNELSRCA